VYEQRQKQFDLTMRTVVCNRLTTAECLKIEPYLTFPFLTRKEVAAMLEPSLRIDAAVMVSNALSNGLLQRFSGSGSCSS